MDPKVFGKYQIIKKLAAGGMGRVYHAYDPSLNRSVGLKLIDLGTDRESLEVIESERRGALLQDQLAKREPGGRVAQIFDVGELDGYFYIAMEYIEGKDLSEFLQHGPLQPEKAVSIALDILEVLAKAHSFQTTIGDKVHCGIIHGDIKPRNIRITSSGHVKVLDFGIAKAISSTRNLTHNQFGSVPYSSPERLQTGDVDARSDVWSVGIVLFEMLAGKQYFQSSDASKLEATIRNYRQLSPAIATVPAGLRDVLSRALHPDPNRRFGAAFQLQRELCNWRDSNTSATNSTRRTSDPDATRRTILPIAPAKSAFSWKWPDLKWPDSIPAVLRVDHRSWILFLTIGPLFLTSVCLLVVSYLTWQNSEALRKQVESNQIPLEQARTSYSALTKRWAPWFLLLPARNSMRDRYLATADRVIADYRESSESTPVTKKDWQRAKTALTSALALVPGEKSIRGKSKLVNAHLKLADNDVKTARAEFEEARALLPNSPDPHVGLAQLYMRGGREIDKAEAELKEAEHHGFHTGHKQQALLAAGYRLRAQEWVRQADHANEITQMEEALRKADSDFAHAQELYGAVAPFYRAIYYGAKVSQERAAVAKKLAMAKQAKAPTAEQTQSDPTSDPTQETH